MATGFYLLDHPNRTQQYRYPRRERISGMVGVHTSEGVMDDVGIDTGAENVAAFIVSRSDYGSYHEICDSDSIVRMAPADHETWHIAADAHNWHSFGVSAACRTVDWHPNSAWTRLTIRNMGISIARFWNEHGFDVEALAGRWLTIDQARRREPGLIEHGTAQPLDRTDSWARLQLRDTYRRMLTDAILLAHRGGIPTTPDSEDWFDMATRDEVLEDLRNEILPVLAQWEKDTRAQTRAALAEALDARLGTTLALDERDGTVWRCERPGNLRSYVDTIGSFDWLVDHGTPYIGVLEVDGLDAFEVYPPNLSDADIAKVAKFTADELDERYATLQAQHRAAEAA
jgi:hypothetical protein